MIAPDPADVVRETVAPQELAESTVTDPQPSRSYQAIGTVEGCVTLFEDLEESPRITIAGRDYWISYTQKVLQHLREGELQRFWAYPAWWDRTLGFRLLRCDKGESKLGFTLKGCWIARPHGPTLAIYRNPSGRGSNNKSAATYLDLVWEAAPEPEGQFWELQAELREAGLVVTAAEGPFPPPPRWYPQTISVYHAPPLDPASRAARSHASETGKRRSQSLAPSAPPQPQPSAPPGAQPPAPFPVLSPEEIRAMAVPAKVEVSCKITEVPPHRTTPEQLVEFYLADGDRILTVRVKPKQFKKLTNHGFDLWLGVISGQLGPATETGFELLNAGIQVFERKSKEPKPESEATSAPAVQAAQPTIAPALARPQATASAAKPSPQPLVEPEQPAPSGRKNLLKSVAIR